MLLANRQVKKIIFIKTHPFGINLALKLGIAVIPIVRYNYKIKKDCQLLFIKKLILQYEDP